MPKGKEYRYQFKRPKYKGWYRIEDASGHVVMWGISSLVSAKKEALVYLKNNPSKRVVTISRDEGKVTKYVK